MERIIVFSEDEIHDLASGKIVKGTDGYDGSTALYMSTMRYAKYVKNNENGGANNLADLISENREWTPCYYENGTLHHDGTWEPGRWYEWIDRNYNIEIARMKADAYDHFFPDTKIIKEEDVIAFRETSYRVTLKLLLKEEKKTNDNR